MREIQWLFAGLVAMLLAQPVQAQGKAGDDAGKQEPPAVQVKWRTDYKAARLEAAEKKLPICIYFCIKINIYCRMFEDKTLSYPQIANLLNEHFIPMKIESDSDSALPSFLNIERFPSIVLATHDGKIILPTIVGYKEPAELRPLLQKALDQGSRR